MKRIEIEKLNSTPEDSMLFEKWLQSANIPFSRIEREGSGAIAVWVEDEFEQPALEVLRREILKLSDPSISRRN